ncbi:hypothetical protein FRC09_003793 [Ceratobasidium sp. 395]|nr:hypothetical protein FRC09_003793 [Ceratobasidium sp. 395]
MGPNSADTTGFKRRMPAIGAGLDRDAQVWEVYVDETDRSDRELVKSWNDSLDVLLIFVTLFSAITTALVIESSKRLQPDPAETSAQTLQAMSQILIAISNGQPVNSSTSFSASTSQFSPSRSSVLVNALWYLSLTLSVAVSLVAMVSKSWCNVFMSNRTASDKYEQGRRRQRKWNAIETWDAECVKSTDDLTVLFAVGLSVYLWDICISVAVPVFSVTVVFVSLYAVATILPLVHQDCPYSTPLSKPLKKAISLVDWTGFLHHLQRATRIILSQTRRAPRDLMHSPVRQTALKTESVPMDKVTAQMLLWLISNCEDSQLVDIALQSIAGARPGFPVETLIETVVIDMLVQRLSTCLVANERTGTICLKLATSIEEVGLYAQALARLLESGASFISSFEYQIPQLSCKQLDDFFDSHMNKIIAKLKNRFLDRIGENDNITTLLTSFAAPLRHNMLVDAPPARQSLARIQARTAEDRFDQLIQSHLDGRIAIDSRALLPLLEAIPHWIIHRMMLGSSIGSLGSLLMLLVKLVHSPSCSAHDFQYAIGLSLAVATVLMRDYPGWERPSHNIKDRTARAIEVYRYYKLEHYVEPKELLVSGLLGLLHGVSETPVTFSKNEVTIVTDVLAQTGDFSSVLGYHLHTLPENLDTTQHAKTILMEILQGVAGGQSDFGETAVIPCLTQLLHPDGALADLNTHRPALGAFLGAQNSRLRRICSPLLLRWLPKFFVNLKDLEPAQLSGLIDISLGDDAYSAPTAMMCLWRLTSWLIEEANRTSNGQLATVLADMLKHDAFTSLRAKIPDDLPVPPKNIYEVGFAEMWYPLLKEMKSHKHAASVVGESSVLCYMIDCNGASGAVPYLEELRDGRSWYDMLLELDKMPSHDVEV